MDLLQKNKKYLNSLLKTRIITLIVLCIVIFVFIILPAIKIILFPDVTRFSEDESIEIQKIAESVWNDGLLYVEHDLEHIEFNSEYVTEYNLKHNGVSKLDFENIVFEAHYDNLRITYESYTITIYVVNNISDHSVIFTFENDTIISIQDNYEDDRVSEILIYILLALCAFLVTLLIVSLISTCI